MLPGTPSPVGPYQGAAPRSAADAPASGLPSIAIAPFVNLSGDPDFDYFASAFGADVRLVIHRRFGLRVAPPASARTLETAAAGLPVMARELGVTHVLEGSARRAADRLSITAQLTRASDGARLWGERFDRGALEAAAVRQEIAVGVARALAVPVRDAAPGAAAPHADAYDFFLRGRSAFGLRRASLERSLECFERAVAIDPAYGDAHAALALSAVALCVYGFTPSSGVVARARTAAGRALEGAGSHQEARLALALTALFVDWDLERAGRDLDAAIAEEETASEPRAWRAWVHAIGGHVPDAIAAGRRAIELDPLSAEPHAMLAFVHVFARQPEAAVAAAGRAVALDAASFQAHRALAAALLVAGRAEAARPELDQAALLSRRHQWCLADLAVVCRQLGDTAAAEALHAELLRRSTEEYVQRIVLAETSAALGRLEDAFKLLDQAAQLREPLPLVGVSPYFDAVRDHPRFRAILERSRQAISS